MPVPSGKGGDPGSSLHICLVTCSLVLYYQDVPRGVYTKLASIRGDSGVQKTTGQTEGDVTLAVWFGPDMMLAKMGTRGTPGFFRLGFACPLSGRHGCLTEVSCASAVVPVVLLGTSLDYRSFLNSKPSPFLPIFHIHTKEKTHESGVASSSRPFFVVRSCRS